MIYFFKYVIERGGEIKLLDGRFAGFRGISNPSIIKHHDKYLMTFRSCEYTFFNFWDKCPYDSKKLSWYPIHIYPDIPLNFMSFNYMCEYDPETMSIKNPVEIFKDMYKRDNYYNGAEDLRLWIDDLDRVAVSFSEFESDGYVTMNFAAFDDDFNAVKMSKHRVEQCEKNWMPVSDQRGCFVRKAFGDIVTLSDDYDTLSHYGSIEAPLPFRGSSQMFPYKDTYICVVHTCRIYNNKDGAVEYKYYHKFIQTDKEWNIIAESDWFVFAGMFIEFNCGIHIENDELLMPVSLFDSTSFMIKIKMEHIMGMLNKVPTEATGRVQYDELSDIILESSEERLTYSIDEYILKHADNNMAAAIACKTHLASAEEDVQKRVWYYVEALCDIKKFDFGMNNRYMHMLLGQDVLRDHIAKFI